MAVYREFEELETKGWGNADIAAGYVTRFADASDMAIPAILSHVPEGSRVLDLCCGQGNVTQALAGAGHRVTGADFSPQMLAHARTRFPEGDFVETDAQNMDFDDDSFDVVTCSFGLMHIPDQPKALSEIRRVLRPGGRFIMTSWCGPEASPVFAVFYKSVMAHGHPSVKLPESPDFHQYADADTAEALLKDAGLKVETQAQVACYWDLNEPEALAEIFETGAPRGGYLMSQQPAENNAAIKAAVAEEVRARFAHGQGWRAPMPAALVVAHAT